MGRSLPRVRIAADQRTLAQGGSCRVSREQLGNPSGNRRQHRAGQSACQCCQGTASRLATLPLTGRKDFVKVSGVRVNVPSKRRRRFRHGFYRRKVLAFQGIVERVHGGPMTVVAGIIALLLLAYLVVALLEPERF